MKLNMSAERIVVRQQGSWKWQQPYGVVMYTAHLADNGKVIWKSAHDLVGKVSWPQLEAHYPEYVNLPSGSLHNKPVARSEAIRQIGISRVRSIESRGWKFGK